jgi:hypothetical protein
MISSFSHDYHKTLSWHKCDVDVLCDKNKIPSQLHKLYLIVFGSGNDPLSTRDRKISKDAIFFVLVPGVRFETLSLAVVPQFESVVEGGSQDVLPVRRELDERNGRVIVVDERFQALTRGCVPNSAKTVVTTRNDEWAIPVEVHGRNRIWMCRQSFEAFARTDVPNPDTFVEGTGDNLHTVQDIS